MFLNIEMSIRKHQGTFKDAQAVNIYQKKFLHKKFLSVVVARSIVPKQWIHVCAFILCFVFQLNISILRNTHQAMIYFYLVNLKALRAYVFNSEKSIAIHSLKMNNWGWVASPKSGSVPGCLLLFLPGGIMVL